MSDNVGDVISMLQQLGRANEIEESKTATKEASVESKQTIEVDTLEQLEQVDVQGVQAPGNPALSEPSQHRTPARTDIEAFLIMFNKVENEVITHILDAWQTNIEENKRLDKEELEMKIRMGLDQIGRFSASFDSRGGGPEGVSASLAVANYAAFMFGTVFALAQLNPAANFVGMNSVHNLNPAVFNMMPAGVQPAIAIAGGMISSGIISPVIASLAGRNEEARGDLPRFALANQVAYQTLQMVDQRIIHDVVNKHGLFSSLTNEQRAQLVSRLNIQFLLNSLALFYEKETGWVTEEELVSLIGKGDVYEQIKKENPDDPRLALVAALRQEMKGLPKGEREAFLKESLRHLSKNPSYGSQRELEELMGKMWKFLDYEQMSENAA